VTWSILGRAVTSTAWERLANCLLTAAPFEGDDVGSVLQKGAAGRILTPSVLDPSIDRALEAVCLRRWRSRRRTGTRRQGAL